VTSVTASRVVSQHQMRYRSGTARPTQQEVEDNVMLTGTTGCADHGSYLVTGPGRGGDRASWGRAEAGLSEPEQAAIRPDD
jgi:hypothetical protein